MLIPFDALFKRHNVRVKNILHLGANTGQEAETYNALGMETVVWVEAIPKVFAELKAHVGAFKGHIPLLACVSDVDGKATFNVASNDGQSSSILEFGTHAKEHPTVKFVHKFQTATVRVDTLLARYGLEIKGDWLLNIDLQGAELLALKGMGELLNKFKYAYIEVNNKELYKGCPLVEEIDKYLAEFGFVGVETSMTKHGWGDKMYIRQITMAA